MSRMFDIGADEIALKRREQKKRKALGRANHPRRVWSAGGWGGLVPPTSVHPRITLIDHAGQLKAGLMVKRKFHGLMALRRVAFARQSR